MVARRMRDAGRGDAAIAASVIAVLCCAGPGILALAGGLSAGLVGGLAGGGILVAALAVALWLRRRHRRATIPTERGT